MPESPSDAPNQNPSGSKNGRENSLPSNGRHDFDSLKAATDLILQWLPFLSKDLCENCSSLLKSRVSELVSGNLAESSPRNPGFHPVCEPDSGTSVTSKLNMSIGESSVSSVNSDSHFDFSTRKISRERRVSHFNVNSFSDDVTSSQSNALVEGHETEEEDEVDSLSVTSFPQKRILSKEEREHIRFMNVGRKKDFVCIERVNGKPVNILKGLELHTGVFSAAEQRRLVDFIYELQEQGRRKQLRERTYSEPRKWMRGKGRVTIQFGCCYNYAVDKKGNPPGIIRSEEVDPIPPLFKAAIRRMVRWHVLPPTCVPDSCIVNIYDEGDCIPPHIDHHDFVRPFCTVSLLSECNIVFGSNLKILGPGEFAGSVAIPLPVGSVLILNGNGADVAKHSVPAVPTQRISITFRKMDPSKLPFGFTPEPDLQGIQPLPYPKQNGNGQHQIRNQFSSHKEAASKQNGNVQHQLSNQVSGHKEPVSESSGGFSVDNSDFPPLKSSEPRKQQSATKAGIRRQIYGSLCQ